MAKFLAISAFSILLFSSRGGAWPAYGASTLPPAAGTPDGNGQRGGCYPATSGADIPWDAFFFPSAADIGPLTIYLQDDFASEWNIYYNDNGSSPLTQQQIEVVLQDAMEVWNRESRGPLLVYGGMSNIPVTFEEATARHLVSSCTDVSNAITGPAVYVYFDETDHYVDSTDALIPCGTNPCGNGHTSGVHGVFYDASPPTNCRGPLVEVTPVSINDNGTGGRVVVTTASAHGLAVGDVVTIRNANTSGRTYNGTYTVGSVNTTTVFTTAQVDPGNDNDSGLSNAGKVLWTTAPFSSAIVIAGGPFRNIHNLKANLVHELGHALGFTHSDNNQGASQGGISVMSDAGLSGLSAQWSTFFASGGRSVPTNSPVGSYLQSGPFALSTGATCSMTTCPLGQSCTTPCGAGGRCSGSKCANESGILLRSGRVEQLHLWPNDIDCVDDRLSVINDEATAKDARRRRLVYWSTEYHDGTFRALEFVDAESHHTSKGFLSGGDLLKKTSGDPQYAVFFDADPLSLDSHVLSPVSLNGNGSIPFSVSTFVVGDELDDLTFSPTLTAIHERGGTFSSIVLYAKAIRDILFDDADPNTTVTTFDPPQRRMQRDDDLMGNYGVADVTFCTGDSVCSYRLLQTHMPLTSTWDDNSQQTVFATIPSRGNCETTDGAEDLTCGRVHIFPGLRSGYNYTLKMPAKLVPGSSGYPSLPTYIAPTYPGLNQSKKYEYNGRSDVGVGVACAPAGAPGLPNGANCMIAWSDSGTPDGQVLFTFFEVDAADQKSVSFISGTIALVTYEVNSVAVPVRSVSDLSLAYFDGRFWLAYKSATTGAEAGAPSYVSTDTADASDWSGPRNSFTNHVAADPPTWLYDPHDSTQETAFVFAEHCRDAACSTWTP